MTRAIGDSVPANPAQAEAAPLKGAPWSRDQVEMLTDLWRREVPASEIATLTGRTKRAVVVKASRIGLALHRFRGDGKVSRFPKRARVRNCMRCERLFFSEGFEHRVCILCKTDFNWRDGADYVSAAD